MAAPRGRVAVAAAPCSDAAVSLAVCAVTPRVSFVIPVLNEGANLADLLAQLSATYPGYERIVVDGGSSDDTVAQALPLASSLVTSPAGRARQMNLGAAVATADYVFFLHADSSPTVDQQDLEAVLALEPGWGFCRARLSGQQKVFRVIEWAMNMRSRLTRVATGDQMLFLRRDLLEETAGFADIPLMEDIELSKRLRRRSAAVIIQSPVVTSSRRWQDRGIVRTVLQMWYLRLAYFLGVSPHKLWLQYYGR